MRRSLLILICTAIGLTLPAISPHENILASEPGSGQIVFLFLRLKDGRVTLEKTQVVKGTVKRPKADESRPGGIRFEALSDQGASIDAGSMDDPSVRRLEYEDPEEPGRLRVKVVTESDVTFVVRMPWNPAMKRVRFLRAPRPVKAGGAGVASAPPSPEELGTVEIGDVNTQP